MTLNVLLILISLKLYHKPIIFIPKLVVKFIQNIKAIPRIHMKFRGNERTGCVIYFGLYVSHLG